jgi:LmbE family N-acetylglucosaminyl deacetylase
MSRTVVFFHAHPDDEALLTGGTMARLAAEGHRVVLVTATAGEAGLASTELTASQALADVRLRELSQSAGILGCSRTVVLGYADSGSTGRVNPDGTTFAGTPVDDAARRLAEVLAEERADALTGYDAAGGYGHPDHVQVHRVARRAAELAGTARLLEATVDRRALQRALRLVGWARRGSPDFAASRFDALYTPHEAITHRVDVRGYVRPKREAMRAHASQSTQDATAGDERSLAWMLRLPGPLFRLAFGHEWFVEVGRTPARTALTDVLADLP